MLRLLRLGNEWRLLRRHPLLWVGLAGAGAFSAALAAGSPPPEGSNAHAALLRLNLFIPTFILPFLAGAVGPVFFLREAEHDLREIVGSYPLRVRDWLTTRLGSFLLFLLISCLLAQIVFVGALAPDYPGSLGNLAFHSAEWLLLIHAPACLLWSCLLTRLSSSTGQAGFLYLAAGIGWAGYVSVASLTGTPLIAGSFVVFGPLEQAMLILDPYGVTALGRPTPEHGLLQSRELNLTVGRTLWLLVCFWLVRGIGELPSQAGRGLRIGGYKTGLERALGTSSPLLPAPAGHLRLHLRFFYRDRIVPLLVGAWILLLGTEAYAGLDYAEPLARVVPDSRDALNRVTWDVLPLTGAFLLLYAADRICRMYGTIRMHELVAATPYRSWALLLLQLASLWIIAAMFLVLGGIAVLLAQTVAESPVQPMEYLLQLGLAYPQLALFCFLFTAVHGLVRLRFLANLLNSLLVTLCFSSLAPTLGLNHPLWMPLATPLMQPDHVWGFEGSLGGHIPYLLFWLPLCLAVLGLAIVVYHRNLAFQQVRWGSIGRRPAAIIIALLSIAIWQGKAIHDPLRAEGLLVSAEERVAQRASYERLYARWAGVPQPDVAAITSWVDVYPDDGRVHLRATLRLVNRTGEPISRILVGRDRDIGPAAVALEGASLLHEDDALGQQVFELHRPMAPGGTLRLRFETQITQSGLTPASMPLVLRPSFSSVPAHALLPVVGFKRELTLRDPENRKSQGLPELRLTPPSRLRQTASLGWVSSNEAFLDTVISTKASHRGLAPGELLRTWRNGGRAFFHYRSDGPIRNMPVFYSVPWQPQQWQVGSVTLQVFSPRNLDIDHPSILGIGDTLSWLGNELAPYPGRSLRMIVVPELGITGFAFPQTILISHRLGVRARPQRDAGFSQPYRRAAHETAHQWFGHMIGHGIPEERAFLIESLAKYAELVMLERRYGKDAMHAVVAFEWDRYRQARPDLQEQIAPLIDAEENPDQYSRATLVFACLRRRMGDEPILAALRRLVSESRRADRPATSVGFVDALQAAGQAHERNLVETMLLGREPVGPMFARLGCRLAAEPALGPA